MTCPHDSSHILVKLLHSLLKVTKDSFLLKYFCITSQLFACMFWIPSDPQSQAVLLYSIMYHANKKQQHKQTKLLMGELDCLFLLNKTECLNKHKALIYFSVCTAVGNQLPLLCPSKERNGAHWCNLVQHTRLDWEGPPMLPQLS